MSHTVVTWYRTDFQYALQAVLTGIHERTASPRHGVFIVEDHAGMRRMLRRLVGRSSELRVVGEAASAEEALEKLAIELPKVVMVDINLPGMSGLDLIAILKQRHPEVRCVVVSAYSGLERRRAALQAGAQGFVSKDEPSSIVAAVIEAADSNGE